ncbi:MAG TPA: hypothetical protein VH012_09425 [Acidimicrobiales bacterium]|nr:hypothetical protein [Acidimicrobiales bacterium]
MKTMTCKQLGGPCDFQLHGETADVVIKAQDRHLKDLVAAGDDAHKPALKDMKGRWRHPISGMGWYKKAKRDFADLAED